MRRVLVCVAMLLLIGVLASGCATGHRPPRNAKQSDVTMVTTGYCKCGRCCNWKRNWRFKPVIASGPSKGKPKRVGVTAMGTKAKKGTIAADTKKYPFGTVMYVPGYGYGRVEDRGSGVQGEHIDLFFKSHQDALKWGKKKVKVRVWVPRG